MADPARNLLDDDDDAGRDPDVTESYDEDRHGGRPHFYSHAASGRFWQRRHPMFSDEQLRRLYDRGRDLLIQALNERPLTTISGAFVVGYLLGNGLPPALARSFTGLGLRILLQQLAEAETPRT